MIFNIKDLKKVIDSFDVDRIYVENVRSVLRTNTRIAKLICDLAVKKGFFEKFYALACQNDSCARIIASYSSLDQIPESITCQLCEEDGEEKSTFKSSDLEVITFYKYVRNSIDLTQSQLA